MKQLFKTYDNEEDAAIICSKSSYRSEGLLLEIGDVDILLGVLKSENECMIWSIEVFTKKDKTLKHFLKRFKFISIDDFHKNIIEALKEDYDEISLL